MKFLFKALLAATALMPVATAASAQDAPRERGDGGRGNRGGDRADRGERGQQPQARFQVQAQPQQQRAPDQPARVAVDRDMARGADWYGSRVTQPRNGDRRQGRPGAALGANVQTNTGRDGLQARGDVGAGWRQDRARPDAGRQDATRRDYRPLPDQRQGQGYQNGRPGNGAYAQRDRDWNDRGGTGQWRGDDRRNDRFDDRGGNRNWSNDWRNDRRYDWGRYRTDNRSAYRLPRYYAPYGWNQGYRRFSVGITLNSILFGQNYWIDDPYSYRLPDAYGSYRWVRYYNDALLVDVRYGRVVDVVHDIFW